MPATNNISGTAMYFYKNEVIKKERINNIKEETPKLSRHQRRKIERALNKISGGNSNGRIR